MRLSMEDIKKTEAYKYFVRLSLNPPKYLVLAGSVDKLNMQEYNEAEGLFMWKFLFKKVHNLFIIMNAEDIIVTFNGKDGEKAQWYLEWEFCHNSIKWLDGLNKDIMELAEDPIMIGTTPVRKMKMKIVNLKQSLKKSMKKPLMSI